ncbi:MAG: DUF58 domain-containing protein [Desulfuromonadaceae bacterium]|nr:DUF58 domain-containing protein [Desulfuromonadaceae bacterium]MDD2846871.1 DUF58 domain-containing protein [Desulfuromonadaceae bacterium]MDD4129151.1 DUF58 domain-containing protein [Desulfuromonadaceae bacterium]
MLYVLITLLIGFAAVNTGNNLLFLVVSGLLAFMSVTGLAGMYNIKKLIPDLHPPEEIYVGTPATFSLSVKNSKHFLPSFIIQVECQGGQTVVVPLVTPNSVCDAPVQITFHQRGEVLLGLITISSPYPVGFFTRYWRIEIDRKVTVFPAPIASDSVGGGEGTQAVGVSLRRERGLSGELERIYPYSGSEPLRMIHWKHSARSHDLLVKGFGMNVVVPLVIELDGLPGYGVEEKLSRAAWLVQRWWRNRPIGLHLGGRIVAVGTGKRHALLLLRELALYGSD